MKNADIISEKQPFSTNSNNLLARGCLDLNTKCYAVLAYSFGAARHRAIQIGSEAAKVHYTGAIKVVKQVVSSQFLATLLVVKDLAC